MAGEPVLLGATLDLLEDFGVFTNKRSSLCSLTVFKIVFVEESGVELESVMLSWISKFEHSNMMSLSSAVTLMVLSPAES